MSPPPIVHASWAMMIMSVALLAPPIVFIFIAKRGRQLYIRRIPGIDAIEEALGRATELGRPIVFTTGLTGLDQLLFAVLGVLSHIGKKSAAFGCRLIVPQRDYEVMPVVSETVRESFRSAGRLDAFSPQDIRYLSPDQFAFASGYMGIVHREKAASCFMFGEYAAESLVLAEAGQQVGAMQVAGTVSYNQVPFFLTSCDYTIIGEEVYAAGAYLSRNPAQLGSIRGQDVAKLVVLGLILVGVIAATAASAGRTDPNEGIRYNSRFAQLLYAQPKQARVLADFEVKDAFRPPDAPTAEDLANGQTAGRPADWMPSDLEQDLARLRSGFAREGTQARRLLRRTADGAEKLSARLRPALERMSDQAARDEAGKLADRLDQVAVRAAEEADKLDRELRENLPSAEREAAAHSRERAAAMAAPELAVLADWVADNQALAGATCTPLIDKARATLGAPGSTAVDIGLALRSAREACYRLWFAEARKIMALAKAEEMKDPPTFLIDMGAERRGASLIFDGTRSVSGRLMPLSYTWTVSPAPGPDGKTAEFAGPQPRVPFARAGMYEVKLKASEEPSRPRPMVLTLLTKAPTEVRHETIAAGTEFKFSWRPPKGVDLEKVAYTWNFNNKNPIAGTGAAGLSQSHKYDQPGTFLMTLELRYERAETGAAAAEAAKAADAAEAEAEPWLKDLRFGLAVGLTDLCDQLAELDEHLSAMKTACGDYADRLAFLGETSAEAWPDRALMARLGETAGELRSWADGQNKALSDGLSAIQTLGAARHPASVSASEPTPAAAGPSGTAQPANGSGGPGKVACWNRFRVYFNVVAPKEDTTSRVVSVRPSPMQLSRAPWEPRPKPPETKPAAAAGAKEVAQ